MRLLYATDHWAMTIVLVAFMFHFVLLRVTWADLAAFSILGDLATVRDPARFFCHALPLQQSSTKASPDIVVTWSVTTQGILHTHKNTFKLPNPRTVMSIVANDGPLQAQLNVGGSTTDSTTA